MLPAYNIIHLLHRNITPKMKTTWPFYNEVHEIISMDFSQMNLSEGEDEDDGEGVVEKEKKERGEN